MNNKDVMYYMSNVDAPKQSSEIVLASIDHLIQNGQPQFGVFARVNHINYMDYYSHLISQKPVSNWRKQFKANQFAFIQVVQSPYRICLAIATIKLATTAFVYIYNDKTKLMEVVEALQPLMRHTQFEGDHQQGKMAFKHPDLSAQLQFTPTSVSLDLDCKQFAVNTEFQRGNNPLAVCAPSGRRGWVFTQKEPFEDVAGELVFKHDSRHYHQVELVASEQQYSDLKRIELGDKALANLDWTLGYMRHETNWFWASIITKLVDRKHSDGRLFMLNLSMGVNETGVSENACWLDGKIYYLPPVMFKRSQAIQVNVDQKSSHDEIDNVADLNKATSQGQKGQKGLQQWTITNQHLGWSLVVVKLTFTPISVYKKTDNFGFIASLFEQWVGLYSGSIKIGDDTIILEDVIGLAEDHYAKW